MRSRGRHRLLLVPLIALAFLAASCGGDDDDGSSGGGDQSGRKEGGTAATGEGLPDDTLIDYQTLSAGNPNHIDPATADTRQGSQVTDMLYDGLTDIDSENELVPAVADEWEANEDSSEWSFTLRDDVTFSDGEPVTPTTFKESWERALDAELASSLSYHFLPIQGAEELAGGEADELTGVVADDEANTLTVTLTSPLSDWPAIVSHTVFSPVPEAAYSAEGDDINDWERGEMIGNGPYVMDGEWQDNEVIKVTANPEYWGEAPQVQYIEFRISADIEAAYAAFEGGEGDTSYIPAGAFEQATADYNNSTEPSFGLYYFGIAWEDDELGGEENLAVRQAISMAIDRDRINEQVNGNARENATGVTPPGIPGFLEDICGEYCTYDPDAATDLVEEWGKADTMRPIQLQFNLGGDHEDLVNIVQENLEAIGLKVEQDPRDGETYFDEMQVEGGCVMCRAGWIWDYPSYYNGMYSLFTSSGVDGDNLGRFSVEEFDQKAAEAAAESDEDRRAELWNEAEQILFDNMGAIVVNWYTNQVVYSDRVAGLVVNGLQDVNYEELTLAG